MRRALPRQLTNRRGAVLGVVMLSALVFSVGAYAMLSVAWGRSQYSEREAKRIKAQYAAEAAVVIAGERIARANPVYPVNCTGTPPQGTDTIAIEGTSVLITVTNCGTGDNQQISAQVGY